MSLRSAALTTLLLGLAALSVTAYSYLKASGPYRAFVYRYSEIDHTDPLLGLAIIQVESGFDPAARSRKGAMGLMQLMPLTALQEASELHLANLTPANLEGPELNVRLGLHHLSKLQQKFKGDPILTLAAYNAGEKMVREWLGNRPSLRMSEIPYSQTRNFVKKVMLLRRCLAVAKGIKGSIAGSPLNGPRG